MLDVPLIRMEYGVFPFCLLPAVILEGFQRWFPQQYNGNQVEPGHKSHTDIAHGPRQFGGFNRTVIRGKQDEDTKCPYRPALLTPLIQIAEVGFGHVIIGHDGGKDEKEQCQRDKSGADAGKMMRHGMLRVFRTDLDTWYV